MKIKIDTETFGKDFDERFRKSSAGRLAFAMDSLCYDMVTRDKVWCGSKGVALPEQVHRVSPNATDDTEEIMRNVRDYLWECAFREAVEGR